MAMLDLTEEQQQAVKADGSISIIEAGAGTGKTRTLAARIADFVLNQGEPPERVLALAFTRQAVHELRERIVEACGAIGELVEVDTITGHMLRQLRRAGRIPPDHTLPTKEEEARCWTGLWEGPQRHPLAGRVRQEMVRRLIIMLSACSPTAPATKQTVAENPDAYTLLSVFSDRLRLCQRIPPWSIPLSMHMLLETDPGQVQRYSVVLLDEAHDATAIEWAVAGKLSTCNVTYVLDPRQCIFSWRGGMVPEVLGSVLPVFQTPIHRLTRSWRFGQAIADLANRTAGNLGAPLAPNPEMQSAVVASSSGQPGDLSDALHRYIPAFGGANVAILARTNTLLDLWVTPLPNVVRAWAGQNNLLTAAHLLTRLAMHPRDQLSFISLCRLLEISDGVVRWIVEDCGGRRGVVEHARRALQSNEPRLSPYDGMLRLLLEAVPDPLRAKQLTLQSWIRRAAQIVSGITIRPDDPTPTVPYVLASEYGLRGREALDRVAEALREESRGVGLSRQNNAPIAMTVHSAKGLEWDVVILLTTATWPHPACERDPEERRVLYVAQTRARRVLHMLALPLFPLSESHA